MSFFAELKRRNVLRAGALYIGAAWALSQGVAQLLPVFDFPNWVVRWFVIAALIGFPFAMVLSWFYEWTPHGIVRETEVASDESVTRETGRKMDRWIIAVMAVAIVLLIADIAVPHNQTESGTAAVAQTFLSDHATNPEQAQQLLTVARNSVNKALTLDPKLAAGHAARALVLLFADTDVVGAEAEFRHAVELDPNDPGLRASLAQARAALGHPAAAIEPIRKAIALDPQSPNGYSLLEVDLMAVGRLDEAEQVVRKESELLPAEDCGIKARLSSIEVLRGRAAQALELAKQTSPGKCHDIALAIASQIGNESAAASAALKTVIDRYASTDAYFIARIYALRKDPDQVFAWLDRARANRDNNISILYYDPFLLRYRDDPRFAAFCTKVGLPTPAEVAADVTPTSGGADAMTPTQASGQTP